MIGPFGTAGGAWSADGPAGAVVAAIVGGLLGRLLTWWVGRLLATGTCGAGPAFADRAVHRTHHRWIEVAAIVAAVVLWWWEVRSLGQLPPLDGAGAFGGGPAAAPAALVARWGTHVVLFFLLAAASWIDIRHRVIPDAITVPGVLLGLLCAWAWPEVLLPVACEVPRSFAPPRLETDVLGLCGGLRSVGVPAWLGPRPHPGGLVAAVSVFAVWWLGCTAPFLDAAAAGPRRGWREPRNLLLACGLAAIAVAWGLGGDRFAALQSSLAGMAVSGGIVWAVRVAASRALGREAMGFGDVTLMTMVGAWIGWQACVLAFFLAAFIGLAHGVVQLVAHRENELPYGPSLCLASAVVIVAWRPLWALVGRQFAEPLELAVVVAVVVALTGLTLAVWRRWQ
jgi:prepilin signal peptidase PulO-like enzyme (type II secretory pathway)